MTQSLTLLGLESSCDDTAAAVVRGAPGAAQVLASVVEGQTGLHKEFGGVVPEIAARAHAERLDVCVKEALARAGLTLDQMDVIEINEAFATQVLGCCQQLGLAGDDERLNPNGGAIAVGHPLGASGARLALTAMRQLEASGGRYALVSLCIGIGQGVAMVIERQ